MGATHGKFGNLFKWNGVALDLAAEACTVVANDAQITDAAKRLLNPNCANLVFTTANTVNLLGIDWVTGTAHFDAAPGVTTCAGTGAYIAAAALIKTAYLFDWMLEIGLAAHDLTDFQDDWEAIGPGLANANGSAKGYMVGSNWWDDFEDIVDGTQNSWFLQLFSYDPDDDQTGDHFNMIVIFTGFGINAPVGEYIKETIDWGVHGMVGFVANV